MLKLEQLRELEKKVEMAVNAMRVLAHERTELKRALIEKQARIQELERMIVIFQDDREKIETGINNALKQLSVFEDIISTTASSSTAAASVASLSSELAAMPHKPEVAAQTPASSSEQLNIDTANNTSLENEIDDIFNISDKSADQMEIF